MRSHTVCGLMMHPALAVTTEGLPLGLAAAKVWSLQEFKGVAALKRRVNLARLPIEQKESIRWVNSMRQSTALYRDMSGGNPPLFDSTMRPPSDGVIAEMRRVYEEVQVPRFLDPTAVRLLAEARTSFDRLGLRHSAIARDAGQLLLFPWVGERQLNALRLALARADLAAEPLGIALAVAAEDEDALAACLGHVAGSPPPDPRKLATLAGGPQLEKFDRYLGDELLTYAYASEHLDVSDLPGIAFGLVQALRRVTPES